jgi:hypothetical protein
MAAGAASIPTAEMHAIRAIFFMMVEYKIVSGEVIIFYFEKLSSLEISGSRSALRVVGPVP